MTIARAATVAVNNGTTGNNGSCAFSPDATWQAGDIVVFAMVYANNSAITPDANFTAIPNQPSSNSTSCAAAAYTHVLTAADVSTPPTWTFSIGTSTRLVGLAFAVPGCNTTTPVDSASAPTTGGGSTALSASADTTTATQTYIYALWCARWSSATGNQTITAGTGLTQLVSSATNHSSTTVQVALAAAELNGLPTSSAGSYGPYAATASTATSQDLDFTLALKVASAGPVSHPQTASASVTVARTLTRRVGLVRTRTTTVSPTLIRQVAKSWASAVATAGSVARSLTRARTGAAAVTAAATAGKVVRATRAALVHTATGLARGIARAFSATVGSIGTAGRTSDEHYAATVTVSASSAQTFLGAVFPHTASASVTTTGSRHLLMGLPRTVTVTPATSLIRALALGRTTSVALAAAGVRATRAALAALVHTTATTARQLGVPATAVVATNLAVGKALTFTRTASVGMLRFVRRAVRHGLAALVHTAGSALAHTATRYTRTITGTVHAAPVITRLITRAGSPRPLPDLTLTITPPGGSPVDRTLNLPWAGGQDSFRIDQNFGRQGDTATITLVDEHADGTASFFIEAMSTIKLVDNTLGVTLFGGVVVDPKWHWDSPNRVEWTLDCVDYSVYAANAVVSGDYAGVSADDIVVALTAAAGCGITAAKVSAGGFVEPGPVMARVVVPDSTLANAWAALGKVVSTSAAYGWYVDENLALHWYNQYQAADSGVTVTTSPTTVGSATEAHIDPTLGQITYEQDGTTLHNRVYVHGSNVTHYGVSATSPVDTFLGDGYSSAWPLRYTLDSSGSVKLKIQGVTTTVGIYSGTPLTTAYQVVQSNNGQWFLQTNGVAAPGNGLVLQLWYDYTVPVVALANDRASQTTYAGPNGGVFAEVINDTSLTTAGAAFARAAREIAEYGAVEERLTFTIPETFGGHIRAGQTFTLSTAYVPDPRNGGTLGITGTFLVVKNSIQVSTAGGGYRIYQITAVRV